MDPPHQFRTSQSPHIPGLEISRGHHTGKLISWRLFPLVQVRLTVSGAGELRWGTERWLTTAGNVLIAAPDCNPHVDRRLTLECSTLTAFLTPELFDSLMSRHGGPFCAAFQEVHGDDPALAAALSALALAVELGGPEAEVHSALEALGAQVCRRLRSDGASAGASESRPEVQRLRAILRERLAEPVRLDDLTEEVGLSKFHLVRLFTREVGVPPHAFQMHLRISRARTLLAAGVSAADVAVACGFADQSHFTRCFKRIVGYTPGTFKKLA